MFILKYKVEKLHGILPYLNNSVVFSVKGKRAIYYLDLVFVPYAISALDALERESKNLLNRSLVSRNDILNLESMVEEIYTLKEVETLDLTTKYKSFVSEVGLLTDGDLDRFSDALENQISMIKTQFGTSLLSDGFCDLDEIIASSFLDKILEGIEWGGQFERKKDWMHVGVDRSSENNFLIK